MADKKPRRSLTSYLKRRVVASKKASSQKLKDEIKTRTTPESTAETSADSQQAETPEVQTTRQLEQLGKATGHKVEQIGGSYYRWSIRTTAENIVKVRHFAKRRKTQREDRRTANQSDRTASAERHSTVEPEASPTEPRSASTDRNIPVEEKKKEAVTRRRKKTDPVTPRTDNGRAGKIYYGQRDRVQPDRTIKPTSRRQRYHTRHPRQNAAQAARNEKRVRKQVDRILQRKRVDAVRRSHGKAAHQAQRGAKAVVRGISLTLREAFAAAKALAALVGALGGSAVCILIVVAAVAAIGASAFGLFFNDGSSSADGMTLQSAIASINQEYIQRLNEVEAQNQPYDNMAIYGAKPSWKEVLAVYAAKTTSDQNIAVSEMDGQRRDLLAQIFWDMTSISTSKGQTSRTVKVQVDVIDEEGQPTGEKKTEYRTETTTILKITISGKTADEMRGGLSETASGQLTELLAPGNDALWNDLLGSFSGGAGALEGAAATVAEYLLEQGFTTEATAAILGNIKAECGWNYSTIGVLDGLYHPYERNIGIFQFTTLTSNPNSNDEYWRFMRWCSSNGLFYGSLDAQLRWAFSGEAGTSLWSTRWHERGRYYSNAPGFTEELYANRDTTPAAFQGEDNVAYATYSWMAYYEGCTNGKGSHLDNRLAYAYEYYDQLITTSTVRLIWPTDSSTITSYFGPRESPGGVGSTDHKGIDIAAPEGTPIYAAASGTVTLASYSESAGNWIRIDHGNGICTTYMHCSALYVSKGEDVVQGQTIAAVGSTGHSTGAHLDFRVEVGGEKKNPLDFVSPP